MNILSVHGRVWLFVCVLLSLFTNRTDADIVCNTVAGATVVDFAFAIDTSGSMCPYIEQLTDSLAYFALKLQNLNVDARFAVIAFGGKPQILLPFTADSKLTASTLRNIDCTGGGQEASLEAIRALLAPNYGADFLKSCEYYKQKNGKSGDDYCNIIWRTNAKKNIILITDEDSDLPTLRNYRVRNQTSSNALCANRYSFSSGTPYCSSSSANFEPNWEPKAYWSRYNTFFRTDKGMVIDPAYQYEIDLTASLVVASDVSINMLINSGVNPATSNPQSYYDSRNLYWIATKSKTTPNYKDSLQTTVVQFGDPSLTATDDTLLKFDSALTLKYLIANGLGKSLQGRVLAAGGFLRLFEINDLLKTTVSSNGNTFTQNFYNATANSVTTCITIPGTNPHSDLPPPILTDIAPVPSSLLTTTTTKTTATTTTTKTTSTTSTTPTKTTSSTTTTSTTTTPTTTTTSTSSTTTSTSTSTTTTSTATSTTTSTSTSTTTTSTTITTSTSTTSTTSTATTSTTSTTTTDTTSTTSTTTTDTTSTTSTTSTATTSTTSTTSTDTTSTTSTMTASAASTPTQITASTPSTNVGLVSAATTTPFTSEKTSTTTTTTTSTTSTETTTTTRTTSTTTDSTTTSSTTTDTTTTSSTTTTDTTTTTSDTTTTTTTDTTTTTTTSTTTTDTTTTTTTSTTTTDSTTTTSTTTTTTTDTTTTTTTDTTTTTTTTDSTTTSDTTTTTSTTTSDTPTSTTTTTTFTPVIIPNVFCGGGVVGNGTCLISGQCCSQYGYCDVGLDYCGTTDASEEYIDPQDEGMANSTIPGSDTCGYGVIGNGICDDSLLECSKWGWCMPAEVTGTPKPAPTYDPNGVIEGTETPQPNTDSGTEEKSTLSNTALAGGVGAGVLCLGAAASLFVLRRNRSSQMVSLFSVGSGDVFGNQVADNPLYRKEGNYVENPLFKVANEPVKGTAETADNV